MNHFLMGFADELIKTAVSDKLLKRVAAKKAFWGGRKAAEKAYDKSLKRKLTKRHPIESQRMFEEGLDEGLAKRRLLYSGLAGGAAFGILASREKKRNQAEKRASVPSYQTKVPGVEMGNKTMAPTFATPKPAASGAVSKPATRLPAVTVKGGTGQANMAKSPSLPATNSFVAKAKKRVAGGDAPINPYTKKNIAANPGSKAKPQSAGEKILQGGASMLEGNAKKRVAGDVKPKRDFDKKPTAYQAELRKHKKGSSERRAVRDAHRAQLASKGSKKSKPSFSIGKGTIEKQPSFKVGKGSIEKRTPSPISSLASKVKGAGNSIADKVSAGAKRVSQEHTLNKKRGALLSDLKTERTGRQNALNRKRSKLLSDLAAERRAKQSKTKVAFKPEKEDLRSQLR